MPERLQRWSGWLVAAALLAVGVPLFLRMPLWADATLYAVAARAVASGGVHYRDVFDTNPPGFVWLLCAVRGLAGTSDFALRAADLLLVALVVFGLAWLARKAGSSAAGVAWLVAAVAALYPFVHEFNHVQRDTWMMLPAVWAVLLRLGREEPTPPPPLPAGRGASDPSRAADVGEPRVTEAPLPAGRGVGEVGSSRADSVNGPPTSVSPLPFREGPGGVGLRPALEGLLWGLGCWIKPHLLFIAFAAWLVTARRLSWRDHLATFAGGLLALVAGVAWLVASGAWPQFLDVWRTWNADYLATVIRELPFRVVMQLGYFPPYSVCALAAVPLAVANLRSRTDETPYRKALAAVYLAWLGTALLLQRPFHYVHVPETLLMLAVFAANRWPVPFALVAAQAAAGVLFVLGGASTPHVPPHPAFDARTKLWGACLTADPPREARRGVAMWHQHFGGNDPVERGAVADFLRAQNLRDGELIAWHDSPHALYLDLGIRPRLRFMHVGTAAGLGEWQERQVLTELHAALPGARFAVSDLHRATSRYDELNDLGADGLPKALPAWQRGEFPFNQPVVFRSPSGRYLVHRIERPVTTARIPREPDQQAP